MIATINNRISDFLRTKVLGEDISLYSFKTLFMLTRITIISSLNILVYLIIAYSLGLYRHAFMCTLSLPVFAYIFLLIKWKKVESAKILYAALILFLIAVFSLSFGDGIGSEYWICVVGGVSLLTFKKKSNAFRLILITILMFFGIRWGQTHIDPVFNIDEFNQNIIYRINLVFIFLTSFLITFILRYSSEDFEIQVQKRNKVLQRRNQALTDSINYARRIQRAVLPSDSMKKEVSENLFSIYEPKDIVSGDFYWMHRTKSRLLFAVVDGSGHGVSGALNSIMAYSMLSQCVDEYKLYNASDIIEKLKDLVQERLQKWNDQMADQIEISLCSYDKETGKMEYISNGNTLYLVKHVDNIEEGDGFEQKSSDRYSMKEIRNRRSFIVPSFTKSDFVRGFIHVKKDDMVYLVTDGMSAQFGGPKGKKFNARRLRDLLMSVQHLGLEKQKYIINDVIKNWRGKHIRTDDVTLLGFKP